MRKSLRTDLLITCGAGILAAAAVAFSCSGSESYCGDGNPDEGEQCDDGNAIDNDYCSNNCRVNPINQFYVTWEFNKGAAPQFTGDACGDLGVTHVEVRFYGNGIDITETPQCSLRPVQFQGLPHELPAGMYSIVVRPLDIDGELLIEEPFEGSYQFANGTNVEVIIPPDAWINDYTGTFNFKLYWGGGADCADVGMLAHWVRMTLEQDGVPVAIETRLGDDLDGSTEGPCRPASEGNQSALEVPFGPATFTVVARGSGGSDPNFEETFDTFVGAGVFNPEFAFDVNSTAPDAGPPDAGVPDAGALDAAIDAI